MVMVMVMVVVVVAVWVGVGACVGVEGQLKDELVCASLRSQFGGRAAAQGDDCFDLHSAPAGRAATANAALAGGSTAKNSEYTALTLLWSSMFLVSSTVVLHTSASVAPASSTMALRLCKACLASPSIPPRPIARLPTAVACHEVA